MHLTPPIYKFLSGIICQISSLSLYACTSSPDTSSTFTTPSTAQQTIPTQPSTTQQPAANQKPNATLHKIRHQGIHFNIVRFDSKNYTLEVADQPQGPESLWPDSHTVANKKSALAALNAGFFTPEGKPLGLVIENYIKRGTFNHSSLGSGMYFTTQNGATIKRSKHWKAIAASNPQYLLQSGPMLVERRKPTLGLSSKRSRPRSFIGTDDKNRWILGHATSCTLAQLGQSLTSIQIPDFHLTTALNLDGGSSSDLWVSPAITNGPLTIRPFWNKPVRNFLVLKPRKK